MGDAPARRAGTPGIDVLRIANRSISGWSPFWKGPRRMPFTSEQEDRAILAMMFEPRMRYAQRADVPAAFVRTHRLEYRLATPFTVDYEIPDDGPRHPHDYYLDFRGLLDGGIEFTMEAGRAADKARPRERAKADAARREMAHRGGRHFIVTGDSFSETRFDNYAILRSRAKSFEGLGEAVEAVEPYWQGERPCSIAEVAARLEARFGRDRAETAAWHRVALAAMAGHLVLDLDAVLLTQETEILLLPPRAPAILPPDLPADLPVDVIPTGTPREDAEPATVEIAALSAGRQSRTLRNDRIIEAVRDGASTSEAAERLEVSRRTVERVLARAARGEYHVVPWPDRPFESRVHPRYREAIEDLLRPKRKREIETLRTSPQVKAVWDELRAGRSIAQIPADELARIKRPEWGQVKRIKQDFLRRDQGAREAQSGQRHPARLSAAVSRYLFTIPAPGLVAQVDEHTFDIMLILDGQEVASRVWGAVMVCVKTGAILAGVLSPAPLVEEDYMRLLKQALEPKEALVRRFGCEHDWPVVGRVGEILGDRGLIFVSERATRVIVDNLGITQKRAPAWAPSAKGIVEAIFRFMTKKFAHRFEATTFSSPADRGAHDPERAARRSGMTFSEFEGYFYRAIVDGYMRAYDDTREGPRWKLWEDAVALHGLPRYVGPEDDLKLLLMAATNPRRPDGLYPAHKNGVSFLGHWYVGHEGLTKRLAEAQAASLILYDRRDIVTVYLQSPGGTLLGAATTVELGPGPVSVWERDARRAAASAPRRAANDEADDGLTAIQADALRAPTSRARRSAAQRVLRDQRTAADIEAVHLDGVVAERDEIIRRAAEAEAGIVHLPDRLPGIRATGVPRRRATVEFLDDDGTTS